MKSLFVVLSGLAVAVVAGEPDSTIQKIAVGEPNPTGNPAPRVTLIYKDVPIIGPSKAGFQFGSKSPYPAIEINQGAELRLDDGFKIGATYSGLIDFRDGKYSSSALTQKHNPSVFLAFVNSGRNVIWSIPVGFGTEANGMPIGSAEQFRGFSGLDPDSCKLFQGCSESEAQDHASMSWDYVWVRGFITNATARNRHELVFNASAEFRFFRAPGLTFGDQLNDKNVYVYTKNELGYTHYDGLRLSLGASYENFVLQTHCQLGTEAPVYGNGGVSVSYRLPEEIRKTYPIEPYFAFDFGYGLTMARYFESQAKVNVGVIVRNPVVHAFWD